MACETRAIFILSNVKAVVTRSIRFITKPLSQIAFLLYRQGLKTVEESMALKCDCNVIVTLTSTKIMYPENYLRNSVGLPVPFEKSCRAEVVGGGVKRLMQSLVTDNPKPTKISRSVRVFPIRSGTYDRDPRKLWLLRHRGELANDRKVHPQPTQKANTVQIFPPVTENHNDSYSYPPTFPDLFPPCASPTVAPSSPRPKGGRPTNPIPRHKRSSHINAEHRRRGKIQKGFDTLKEMIPALTEEISIKDSKSGMLHKTAGHVREMNAGLKNQQEEIKGLKKEIADLNAEIEMFQQELPATGIAAVDKPSCHIEAMYNDYLKSRTQQNWKFWLFSFILRPLFESYTKMVTTSSYSTFLQNVREWAHEHLSLVNLRPCILSALRKISLQSSILTTPKNLPEEAYQKVLDYCDNK